MRNISLVSQAVGNEVKIIAWSRPSGWKWYVHILPLGFDHITISSLNLVKCGQSLGHARSTLPECIVQLDYISLLKMF